MKSVYAVEVILVVPVWANNAKEAEEIAETRYSKIDTVNCLSKVKTQADLDRYSFTEDTMPINFNSTIGELANFMERY